jgi:hypothetical protein
MAAVSPLKLIRDYFHTDARPMKLADMQTEWTGKGVSDPKKVLTAADKEQLIAGLTDGTLTY